MGWGLMGIEADELGLGIEEVATHAEGDGDRSHSFGAGHHEQDEELIGSGFEGWGAAEDLAGEHPRQGDKTNDGHAVDQGEETGADRIAAIGGDRLLGSRP